VTIREWPTEFGPHAPGYQPRPSRCRVSTWPNQEPKPSPTPKLTKEEKAQAAPKKNSTVVKWKHRRVSTIRDLPPIPGRFNPTLMRKGGERYTHLTQIFDEYAQIELKEIRLLKAKALPKGSNCQRTAFLSSINKDYEVLVKDEEDPFEDSSEES
jgi:hypothetical protein